MALEGWQVARNRGGLRADSFIRLRELFADGHQALELDEFGRFGLDLA
jgi:hypothetical protein